MRLIDVDKLKRMYAQSDKAQLPCIVDGREIDKAPTVKAIPIEWIKEWGNRRTIQMRLVTKWIIEDWEKENEK